LALEERSRHPGGRAVTVPKKMRPACNLCGGPMGRGRRGVGTCRSCVSAAAAARRERIAASAARGATSREIAEDFSTSPGGIRVELHRLRRAESVNTAARAVIVDH
jgi:DNA-binding CsgD family transcriptional regulator